MTDGSDTEKQIGEKEEEEVKENRKVGVGKRKNRKSRGE